LSAVGPRPPSRLGRRLQSRRRVQDVAAEGPTRRDREIADDLSCLDPDPSLEHDPVGRGFPRPRARRQELQTGAGRSGGVVLAGRRQPEQPEGAVALERRDCAPVALDRVPGERGVLAEDRPHNLRIQSLGQRRRADEVTEQRRDQTPLGWRGHRRDPARGTETCVDRERRSA
jgi:hypothetical protein